MERMGKGKKMEDRAKRFRNYRRGELAKEILLMIAAGMAIPAAVLMPGIPVALKPLLGEVMKKCGLRRSQPFIHSLSHLKRRGLVSVAEKDGQQMLTIAEKGKKRLLQFDFGNIVIRKPRRWDGYWRLVLFDIPESRKQGREALRSKLKQLGFFPLQRSCFVHPFDCKSEIEFICELFEVSPYVNFVLAKQIEGERQLAKYFNVFH